MDRSRKIEVVKRDGSVEAFDCYKLSASLRRVLQSEDMYEAVDIAQGIHIHLLRQQRNVIHSKDILEMIEIVVGDEVCPGMVAAELHSQLRNEMRKEVYVRHRMGHCVSWDKSWVAGMINKMWNISRSVSRILAGEIEMELFESAESIISREQLVRMINTQVSAFGLADAVSVRQYEMEE